MPRESQLSEDQFVRSYNRFIYYREGGQTEAVDRELDLARNAWAKMSERQRARHADKAKQLAAGPVKA